MTLVPGGPVERSRVVTTGPETVTSSRRVYLGEHGQMLVLDDGGPVGRQAALFQTWKQVVQVHAGNREEERAG